MRRRRAARLAILAGGAAAVLVIGWRSASGSPPGQPARGAPAVAGPGGERALGPLSRTAAEHTAVWIVEQQEERAQQQEERAQPQEERAQQQEERALEEEERAQGEEASGSQTEILGALRAPAPRAVWQLDWVVEPGKVTQQATGESTAVERDPLAYALRRAEPGQVIGLRGNHERSGVVIGGGNTNRSRTVYRDDGQPVRGLTVTGLDPDHGTLLGGVTFTTGLGGWDDIRFHHLTFVNQEGARAPVSVDQKHRGGAIWLTDVRFRPAAGNRTFGGHGAKWWIRAHGGCRLYVFDVDLTHSAQEHFLYIDNAEELAVVRCRNRIPADRPSFGRTFLQHYTRQDSSPPPPAWRGILIEDVEVGAIDTTAGGGSAITIGGYPGTVHLRRVQGAAPPARERPTGGFLAVWRPYNYGGVWTDEHGYAVTRLILEDCAASYPQADRPAVMIGGSYELEVHRGRIEGNQAFFDYGSRYSGQANSGRVRFVSDDLRSLDRWGTVRTWNERSEKYEVWSQAALRAFTTLAPR